MAAIQATAPITIPAVDPAADSQPKRRKVYCAAITARLPITSPSAMKTAQPLIHPTHGPKARVVQANVVPQSGSARFRYLKPSATSSIGTNDTSTTAGACTPTPPVATMKPSVAASEYAGAVEATPMTTLAT